MATGKKDIFSRTGGQGAAAPSRGKQAKKEKPEIVSVCLGPKQLIELDRLRLKYQEKTGVKNNRSEIIRHLIDNLIDDPKALDRLQEFPPRVHTSSF